MPRGKLGKFGKKARLGAPLESRKLRGIMELDECDIQEFKKICVEELGLELSDIEAAAEAQRFINFMKAILS